MAHTVAGALAGDSSLKEDLLALRRHYIGPNVALNYSRDPIVVLRGEKQFLYDEHENQYLDGVNNVCHVGHCHPHVVAAAAKQLATLNTNSRYLHPAILEYSKRLTATMPAPLQVVFWVNSGSEANDLAMRMARAYTGKRGIITVDGAYHGHTQSVIEISPYKFDRSGGTGRRPWIREALLPDVFSGAFRGSLDDEHVAESYAANVRALLDQFSVAEAVEAQRRAQWRAASTASPAGSDSQSASTASALPRTTTSTLTPSSHGNGVANGGGTSPLAAAAAPTAYDPASDEYVTDNDGLTAGCAAFIMESILSCGGQVVPPKGYLKRVYESVRKAGGVTIADEVQVGYGRVGDAFWAFELQGVVPDIVTLGKPMGNGFPVAAVVTTPKIAAAFANGMQYFNTYGGNPVAGVVAGAVLDVIEKEHLQAHAKIVGAALLAGFKVLYDKYPFIGSVRGVGLMVGLEILHPLTAAERADVHCSTRRPWEAAASAIVYAMRARRILLSTDGMSNNIVKMKPPMCFNLDDAARLCRELDEVMAAFSEHGIPESYADTHAAASSSAHKEVMTNGRAGDVELHTA